MRTIPHNCQRVGDDEHCDGCDALAILDTIERMREMEVRGFASPARVLRDCLHGKHGCRCGYQWECRRCGAEG